MNGSYADLDAIRAYADTGVSIMVNNTCVCCGSISATEVVVE